MNRLLNYLLSILILAISIQLITPTNSSGKVIVVDDDKGSWADYSHINDAIKNASNEDTIRIYDGLYFESLMINSTIKLQGNNSNSTIITHDDSTLLYCQNNSVIIENIGFNSYSTNLINGINFNNCNITRVSNCSIKNLKMGIINYNTKTIVSNTKFTNIQKTGFYSQSSNTDKNFIVNSTFDKLQIGIMSNSNCDIYNCQMNNVSVAGIYMEKINNCTLSNLFINGLGSNFQNGTGVNITSGHNILVIDSKFQNLRAGAHIGKSDSNFIMRNISTLNNYDGIIHENERITIQDSVFYNNTRHGLYVRGMSGSFTIWNCSFIANGHSPQYWGHWCLEENIFHNETSYGNYWSDFSGEDIDFNGIGDGEYGYAIQHEDWRWTPPHLPKVFPSHSSPYSNYDLSLEFITSDCDMLPLKDTSISIIVRLTCKGSNASNIPITVYSFDGNWEIADADFIFNNTKITNNIPYLPMLQNKNETSTSYIIIKLKVAEMIGIVLNPFSRANHTNGTIYWESDYENNKIIIIYEINNKIKSDSTGFYFSPNLILLLSIILIIIQLYQKRILSKPEK